MGCQPSLGPRCSSNSCFLSPLEHGTFFFFAPLNLPFLQPEILFHFYSLPHKQMPTHASGLSKIARRTSLLVLFHIDQLMLHILNTLLAQWQCSQRCSWFLAYVTCPESPLAGQPLVLFHSVFPSCSVSSQELLWLSFFLSPHTKATASSLGSSSK